MSRALLIAFVIGVTGCGFRPVEDEMEMDDNVETADMANADGDAGQHFHMGPPSWHLEVSNTTQDLLAVCGAVDDVWVVGASGVILRSSHGGAWDLELMGGSLDELHGCFAASTTAVYAAGLNGVLRSDGNGIWSSSGFTGGSLSSVWGTSASNLYAASTSGTIYHSTGQDDWVAETVESPSPVSAIWGPGPNALYAATAQGIRFSNGDGTWTSLPQFYTSFYSIFGFDDVLFAGSTQGQIINLQTGAIERVKGKYPDVVGGFMVAKDRRYVVGHAKTLQFSVGDGNWTQEAINLAVDLAGVWGNAKGEIWVVGQRGTIWHYY